jgi:hypothetical protein
MRLLALAGTLGLALLATSQTATTAQAFAQGPRYCSTYRGTPENCGWYSFEQCLAAIGGVGGMCVVAPMQVQLRTMWTPNGPRRVIREAID